MLGGVGRVEFDAKVRVVVVLLPDVKRFREDSSKVSSPRKSRRNRHTGDPQGICVRLCTSTPERVTDEVHRGTYNHTWREGILLNVYRRKIKLNRPERARHAGCWVYRPVFELDAELVQNFLVLVAFRIQLLVGS